MSKSLNVVLAELGYATELGGYRGKKRIFKNGALIDYMSDGECWNYLRHQHQEYFEKEGNK